MEKLYFFEKYYLSLYIFSILDIKKTIKKSYKIKSYNFFDNFIFNNLFKIT